MRKRKSERRLLFTTLAINILIILTNLTAEKHQNLVFFNRRRTTSEINYIGNVEEDIIF